MDELLNAYFAVGQLSPALMFLIVAGIFAAVRRSERIKPVKVRRNG
jgi:hypothetical protein